MVNVSAVDLAYAAGAIDADGCLTIKRSTTRMRCGDRDCVSPTYVARVTLGQVKPMVPEFLRETFGGHVHLKPGTTPNSLTSFRWMTTDRTAVAVARLLAPLLKIKAAQANAILELADLKETPGIRKAAFWYSKEHPRWRTEPLLTYSEVADRLGYASGAMVTQAVKNGTLLTADRERRGSLSVPRIPAGLVEVLSSLKVSGRYATPPQLIAAQHDLWSRVRELNKTGVNGTSLYHRTGHFKPAG